MFHTVLPVVFIERKRLPMHRRQTLDSYCQCRATLHDTASGSLTAYPPINATYKSHVALATRSVTTL